LPYLKDTTEARLWRLLRSVLIFEGDEWCATVEGFGITLDTSKASIERAIAALRKQGRLIVTKRRVEGSNRPINVYTLADEYLIAYREAYEAPLIEEEDVPY